jgi:hypothetical protein
MKFTKKNKKYKLTKKRYNKIKIGGLGETLNDSWNEIPKDKQKALKIGVGIAIVGIAVVAGVASAGLIPIGLGIALGVASILATPVFASAAEYVMNPQRVNDELQSQAQVNKITREEKQNKNRKKKTWK